MWGTPIPVFSCEGCATPLADAKVIAHISELMEVGGADIWFSRSAGELLPVGTTCATMWTRGV